MILRNGNSLEATVQRKSTNNDIKLHCTSFVPNAWKRGTFRTLVLTAHVICSPKKLLDKEINHFNLIQDGGSKKAVPTGFSPVTSTNVAISHQNILTFSFNPFATLA